MKKTRMETARDYGKAPKWYANDWNLGITVSMGHFVNLLPFQYILDSAAKLTLLICYSAQNIALS